MHVRSQELETCAWSAIKRQTHCRVFTYSKVIMSTNGETYLLHRGPQMSGHACAESAWSSDV